MRELSNFYVDGAWISPSGQAIFDIVNPATEATSGHLVLGDVRDVETAVDAARRAFRTYRRTTREDRIALLERLVAALARRTDEMAAAVTEEMGSPAWFSRDVQAPAGQLHTQIALDTLRTYPFEQVVGRTLVCQEPIGVCALVTPWNFPAGTIMTKLAPALATGCTVVLKPSEYAPYSARLIAEAVDEAGFPPGVFNMIFGDGPTVGAALSSHPDVAMVSITGSTRAGVDVGRRAAETVKRVHQELGGKSPNIVLESADFATSIPHAVQSAMMNSGQGCVAPTRLLVPASRRAEAERLAAEAAAAITVGPPASGALLGPLVNAAQWRRVQDMIQSGLDDGARLVAGGPGLPEGLDRGYFARPTIFTDTRPDMTVVREEIFGPVLVIQEFTDVEDAIEKANDTPYGLAAYLHGADLEELRDIASQLFAGQVHLNGAGRQIADPAAPFGGVKQSGNGRERGPAAFEAYTEMKSYLGYPTTAVA
ncbi:aldehyde dehydrogenase family protein [Phenylobacterium sp.]|uniref:aldehyde dehydrogenase family protein n=1 Tax=Phenylobacterium sp. TaxID=1871053 RepID=UPI00301E108A